MEITDKDVSELFSNIQKLVKEASELVSTDIESAMKILNKINVTANYGKASMLYKASMTEV